MARIFLLTSGFIVLSCIHSSSAIHPFYQAFNPLKDAFGDPNVDMKPSPDVQALFTPPESLSTTIPSTIPTSTPVIDHTTQSFEMPLTYNHSSNNTNTSESSILSTTTPKTLSKDEIPDSSTINSNEHHLRANINTSDDPDLITYAGNIYRGPGPLLPHQNPMFDMNTFTFNRNNVRKVNDIFSALADVDQSRPVNTKEAENHLRDNVIPTKGGISSMTPAKLDQETSNDMSKNILFLVKNVENMLSTMSFMKNIYQTNKLYENKKHPEPDHSTPSSSSPLPTYTPDLNKTVSSIIDVLLDVPTLEGLRTAGLTARSEREFLDHMTSVLIGAETRSTALTLDPVTVIALLTLAAYLLRAVYQILAVTGRSMDVFDGDMNLSLSDLPDALTRVHDWISSRVIDFESDERVTREVKENMEVPGDFASVLKLYRQEENPCVRRFLCQQINYRPFKSLKLSDLITGGLSYYYGEPTVSKYIDDSLNVDSSFCDNTTSENCSSDALNDANSVKIIFTNAAQKLTTLAATYQNWL